jgi:hypothetical protein
MHVKLLMHTSVKINVRINKINIPLAMAYTASCLDIILVNILILFVSTGVNTEIS